jgi:hypothetical protein
MENINLPRLVAITGRRKSGKSMVSHYLQSTFGYSVRSFAGPLKRMLMSIGVPYESLYGTDEQKSQIIPLFGVSGRYMMQTAGTEWGRNLIHPEIWVRSFFSETLPHYTVIDDLRFANELYEVRRHFGTIIGLRPWSGNEHTVDSHESEAGIDQLEVDAWVPNNGTLGELSHSVGVLLGMQNREVEAA